LSSSFAQDSGSTPGKSFKVQVGKYRSSYCFPTSPVNCNRLVEEMKNFVRYWNWSSYPHSIRFAGFRPQKDCLSIFWNV